ncbi:MAG: sigma-70 family RNA polymerase sigma factor [Bdellovibrio sp.]|nr:sigma-70 family RNA polymerase sigma factor [Bdellovibrio sp.]
MERTDEELFALVREHNDDTAFRELYRRYDKRLFGYCLRVMKTREAAEDAFQTILTRVFEKRESFIGGNFSAWLFTIAHNQVINLKQKYNKNVTDIEEISYFLRDESDTTGEDTLLSEALKKAIQSLPEEFREPLELKHFDGFQYEEIAAVLKESESNIRQIVSRSLRLLRGLTKKS